MLMYWRTGCAWAPYIQELPRTVARMTVEELLARARARLSRLAPEQAAAAQARGALLVDIRSEDDRGREGVIPGALHVPLSVLPWRADPDSPDRNERFGPLAGELVVLCNDGYSSSLAAATLQELGFERATDLEGGFRAWRAAGLPAAAAGPPPSGLPGSGDLD
jgi:rhodanese-related sulfurtransferase